MTTLDFEGFKEKILRRSNSSSTVKRYMDGVDKLEEFSRERLGLSLEQLIDEIKASKLDVYEIQDKFVGWTTQLKRRDGNPLMTNSILNFIKGAKKFLRYHGIEIRNETFN